MWEGAGLIPLEDGGSSSDLALGWLIHFCCFKVLVLEYKDDQQCREMGKMKKVLGDQT